MKSLDAGGFLKAAGDVTSAIHEGKFNAAIAMIDELNPRQSAGVMTAVIAFEPNNILEFGEFIGEHMNGGL